MRIHGEIHVAHRQNYTPKNNYQDYFEELSEDFYHICAYCGKKDIVSKNSFEIDHYIPKKLLKKSEYSVYNNLFYCCHTCNRKKSSKWPTGDRNVDNDGNIGLVNPTTKDYDLTLEKKEKVMHIVTKVVAVLIVILTVYTIGERLMNLKEENAEVYLEVEKIGTVFVNPELQEKDTEASEIISINNAQ